MDMSNSDKVTVLLNLLNYQTNEMHRQEEIAQKWFEWSTSLLLAAFGVVIALSGRSSPLPYPILVKSLATILVIVPTVLFVIRILSRAIVAATNAQTMIRLEKLLHLFESEYYGSHSPYPETWAGDFLPDVILKRRTPISYTLVLGLMAGCVVTTIWLVL